MATPPFILELRKHVGTAPLWLIGVTAVVVRGDEVLLAKRADNGWCAPITGIVDPGEEPADAAAREVLEEAAVRCRPELLVGMGVTRHVTYANGDRAQFLDHTFRCSYLSGEPFPADGENTDARWFRLDALPEMPEHMAARVRLGVTGRERAAFEYGG